MMMMMMMMMMTHESQFCKLQRNRIDTFRRI